MPTKPIRSTAGKRTDPVRKPLKPVKPMGSKPLVIIFVVIVAVILGATAYYFLKDPPAPAVTPSAGGQAQTTTDGPGKDGLALSEVQRAVSKAKLQMEMTGDNTAVRVVIDKATDTDGRDVAYTFDWTLNGQPAGDGGERLTGFKRGDRVAVTVTPVEGDKPGQARLLEFLVNNTPPRVVESKQVSFDGKMFSYQVKGVDQDGDVLSYALENAPQAMTINSQTGLVTWPVKEADHGERTFKVRIDDGKSGSVIHTVKVDIAEPTPEAKGVEDQK